MLPNFLFSLYFPFGHRVFVVRRLQEVGRKAGVSLHIYMCFIDPQKAYDTVDRPVAGTHSHRSTAAADDSSHPTIPRWDESLCAT